MTTKERLSGTARDGEPLLAITLCASNAPIPMPTLNNDQLRGFALFKSHRVEDGRQRFRLHLGYFMSSTEAERVLAILRPAYPRAMIAAAPQAGVSSLDNTSRTRFSILQPAGHASGPADPPPVTVARITGLSPSPAVAIPVLEPALAVATPPSRAEQAGSGDPASASSAPLPRQRYAVQLAFGREPIDISALPGLAIYEGYSLYAIETRPGGRRLYGVRLGFYDDVASARRVAQYVRSEFSNVTIVPVSEREVAQANIATIRLPVERASGSSVPLWPQSVLMVGFDPGSHLSLSA